MVKNKLAIGMIFIFLTRTQCVFGEEQIDVARNLLKKAIENGVGDVDHDHTGLCLDGCGYPEILPGKVWRETYKLNCGYQWVIYYELLSDEQKGEVIKKKLNFYNEYDLYYSIWLGKGNEIARFTKKISDVSLIKQSNKGVELTVSAFVNYDERGQLVGVSESLLLIDDINKASDFVDFDIDVDGDIKELRKGKFDYYQLER